MFKLSKAGATPSLLDLILELDGLFPSSMIVRPGFRGATGAFHGPGDARYPIDRMACQWTQIYSPSFFALSISLSFLRDISYCTEYYGGLLNPWYPSFVIRLLSYHDDAPAFCNCDCELIKCKTIRASSQAFLGKYSFSRFWFLVLFLCC